MKNKCLDLFLTFLKIGATTFGGGYAMIPILKHEFVEKKGWINDDEMLEMIAISESTPGPVAINMATFIGYKEKKVLGSILSTLGVIIPSIVIIFIISLFFNRFIDNVYVSYCFTGIKCCVCFLILKVGLELIMKMKKKLFPIIVLTLSFLVATLVQIYSLKFSSIYLILIGATLGIFMYLLYYKNKEEGKEK